MSMEWFKKFNGNSLAVESEISKPQILKPAILNIPI
jgi:hypothetical protein